MGPEVTAVQVQFGLLGPLYARSGNEVIGVPAAKQRVVLAALAVRAGQVVPVAELAGIIWDDAPPAHAGVAVRNYVCRLRQSLGQAGGRIITRPPGYLLEAGDDDVDLLVFTRLCRRGGAAVRVGAWQAASDALGEALALWRGDPLADVPSRVLRDAQVPVLESLRLQASEWRLEAGLRLGRPGELVPELQALVREHPLREGLRAQQMLALYWCGRQGEALAAYASARGTLVAELGVEPGPDLQELHRRILAADPGLLSGRPGADWRSAASGEAGGAAAPGRPVPRQLPAGPRGFAGREAELAALDALAEQMPGAAGTVVISAIGGTAGVGKSALAVHWAHLVAGRFPDGQLYLNLRGFDPSGKPMPPTAAIRALLDALGIAVGQIPAGLDAQAALYRSLLSDRRMLVVLDNARDAAQVRPLLPGSAGCLAVVTSRCQLAGLVAAEGAHALTLDLLTVAEARQMLAGRLSTERLNAEPAATAELIGLCARLPLALAIAAARASARPGLPLAVLAWELTGAEHLLDALDTGDLTASVRTVFSWSLRSLPAPAARMFALLGAHPGPDITVPAAASLGGTSRPQARRALLRLCQAHLITEDVPGRFSLHDLLRAYAAERAAAIGATARRSAVARALDHYLHTTHAAALLLNPARSEPITLSPPQPGVTSEHLDGDRQALAWLEAERQVLTRVVALAARAGFDTCAWQLPWAMSNFLDRRGHWPDRVATHTTALDAATRLGDTAAQTAIRRHLAHSFVRLADYDQARAHLTTCLAVHQKAGDRDGEAHVQVDLSLLSGQQGRHADALGHAEQALALYRATGNRTAQAAALNNLGYSHAQLGRYVQARALCWQAVTMHRELANRSGEANSWDSLGYAEYRLGNLARAADCYSRALGIFGELGEPYYEAGARTHLGDTHHAAGHHDKAREAWQQALTILDDLGHPDADQLRARFGPRAAQ